MWTVSPPIHKNAVSERKSSSLKSMTWLFLCLKSLPRLVQLLRMSTVTSKLYIISNTIYLYIVLLSAL